MTGHELYYELTISLGVYAAIMFTHLVWMGKTAPKYFDYDEYTAAICVEVLLAPLFWWQGLCWWFLTREFVQTQIKTSWLMCQSTKMIYWEYRACKFVTDRVADLYERADNRIWRKRMDLGGGTSD